MVRKTVGGVKLLTVYHTQESRTAPLKQAQLCNRSNAWLGVGYYFWIDDEFAHYWGRDTKKGKSGRYDIYKAEVCEEQILNATFNEKEYYFFVRSIEKA